MGICEGVAGVCGRFSDLHAHENGVTRQLSPVDLLCRPLVFRYPPEDFSYRTIRRIRRCRGGQRRTELR
jgi:hypothetical protein